MDLSPRLKLAEFRQLEADFEVLLRGYFVSRTLHGSGTLQGTRVVLGGFVLLVEPHPVLETRSSHVASSLSSQLTLSDDDRQTVRVLYRATLVSVGVHSSVLSGLGFEH